MLNSDIVLTKKMIISYFFHVLIITCLAISFSSVAGEILFEDVTEKAGLSYYGRTYGSYWGDYNGDRFMDLLTTNHGRFGNGTYLYQNNGDGTFSNTFTHMINETVKDSDLHAASWADFDNDGDKDIMIMVGADQGLGRGPNIFLINEGEVFKESSEDYGLNDPLGRGRIPIWFDENNDGLLDVLLINWPREDNLAPTSLFQQTLNGFVKSFELNWFESSETGIVSTIFQNKKPDMIFLNPSTTFDNSKNLMIKNFGNKLYSINVIGAKDLVIEDFNSDLLFDIFVVTGTDANYPFREDILLIQMENGEFIKQTNISGITELSSCRSVVAGDLDNDMDNDLFLVCSIWGIKNSEVNKQNKNLENILYENLGNGTFRIVENNWGAHSSTNGASESVSLVDYDNNGFLDIFVSNGGGWSDVSEGGPNQLFQNFGNNNHWIEIDLIGTQSNRDGVGTTVKIKTGEKIQIKEQMGGMHYHSQNQQRIHVGAGNFSTVDKIEVIWPSGIKNIMKDVKTNQIIKIIEEIQILSPLKQIQSGVDLSNVECNNELELIFKSTNLSPACVKHSSLNRLIEKGWGLKNFN